MSKRNPLASIVSTEILEPSELLELEALGTPELRQELYRALSLTAGHIRRLATIVRILEDRGEDMSELKYGFGTWLRLVARGQLLPEVIVRFAESTALVNRIRQLPLPDQRTLAAGDPVLVVVRGSAGGFDRRMVDPLKMSDLLARQVFGPGRLRDEAEQIQWLDQRAPTVAGPRRTQIRAGRLLADRRRAGLVLGRSFFTTAEIIVALAALSEDEADGAEAESDGPKVNVHVALSAAQHEALKDRANAGRMTVATLVRRCLAAHGLLAPRADGPAPGA